MVTGVWYAPDGVERIPGRYAVDWVGIDERGRTTKGDADRPGQAIGYGAPVLAVADGTVAAVRDGLVESGSIAGNPARRLDEASGNYVVLRVAPNRFVFYEHLRPGSVVVKVGDSVRTGAVVGALGFTGDSTGPHLHLHVADCASPLSCEGVPFTIRGMAELGRYLDVGQIGRSRWDGSRARGRLPAEWPGDNVVVSFEGDVR